MNMITILVSLALVSLTSGATCAVTRCGWGATCEDRNGQATCICPEVCTDIADPRCGSDGVTYANSCFLNIATCNSQGNITEAHAGRCTPTTDPSCAAVTCPFGSLCEVNNGRASCVCPTICPLIFRPVCGTDGVTYGNDCQLNVKICTSRGQVRKLRDGPCGNEGDMCGGILGSQCASGLVCRYENGQTTPPYPDASGTCSNQTSSGAGEGEMCGGIAGIQCASGLQCRYENGQTTPPYPDASGTCSRRAYLGEMCGGIRGIQCATGLVCRYENGQTSPPYPDAAGTCANQSTSGAGEGEMCGGIRGIHCATGLVCLYENGKTTPPYPDASGTCRNPGAGEGEMCGGIRGIQCASGLVCRYENGKTTPPYPDAAGTCYTPVEACSVSDWRSHYNDWPVSASKKYSTTFGVSGVSGTLKQVINLSGNSVIEKFLRESVAALLNAYSDFNYPLNSSQVIDRVKYAYGNNTRMNENYNIFKNANSAGNCPL